MALVEKLRLPVWMDGPLVRAELAYLRRVDKSRRAWLR
jgi:hypothetical protein